MRRRPRLRATRVRRPRAAAVDRPVGHGHRGRGARGERARAGERARGRGGGGVDVAENRRGRRLPRRARRVGARGRSPRERGRELGAGERDRGGERGGDVGVLERVGGGGGRERGRPLAARSVIDER